MLLVPSPEPGRNGRQCAYLDAVAESFELLAQRGIALLRVAGMETGQHESRFGYGEGALHGVEIIQLLIRFYRFRGAHVYASQHNVRLAARLDIGLQRLLTV